MGAYLNKPVTEKASYHGEYDLAPWIVAYGGTAMQGWRVAMEDAHNIIPRLDDQTSLFAVYDGHGGKEVALYCASNLAGMITSTEAYATNDQEAALKKAFMECDAKLLTKGAIREMKALIHLDDSEDDDIEEDADTAALLEEAEMPLDSLLARYAAAKHTQIEDDPPDLISGNSSTGSDGRGGGVKSMLQMLASKAGFQVDFEDLESSEYEDASTEDEEEEEGKEEEETGGEEVEEEDEWKQNKEDRKEEDKEEEGKGVRVQPHHLQSEDGDSEVAMHSGRPEGVSRSVANHEGCTGGSMETHGIGSGQGQSEEKADRETNSSQRSEGLLTASKGCSPGGGGAYLDPSANSEVAQQLTPPSEDMSCTDGQHCTPSSPLTSEDTTQPQLIASAGEDAKEGGEDCSTIETDRTSPNSSEETGQACKSSPSYNQGKMRKKFPGLFNLLTSVVEDHETPLVQETEEGASVSTVRSPETTSHPSRKRPHPDDVGESEGMKALLPDESSPPKRRCRSILDDEGYHSGTTAIVCLLRQRRLIVSNAGDSRCVLSCKGLAVDMSEDHKPTDPPELERIVNAGGQVGADSRVNGGLNLSRAIGDHFYKENEALTLEEQMITAMPDVRSRTLTDDDEFFVVACDGIWNSKSSQQVVDFIRARLFESGSSLQHSEPERLATICESLCDACLAPDTDNDGTGCDNMTCMIVRLLPHDTCTASSSNQAHDLVD